MKKTMIEEIKGLDTKAILAKVALLKSELADLLLEKNMKKLKDVKVISKKKKEVAVLLTVFNQKTNLSMVEEVETKKAEKSAKKGSSK